MLSLHSHLSHNSNAQPFKIEQMDRVADAIVELVNDPTVRPEALAIAQFMLHTERLCVDSILQQLVKPGAKAYVEKLLACESDILSPTPRSLGVDITSFISADKIQKSLDVKHLHLAVGSKKLDRIIPNIKQVILYSHPNSIWIRFYSESAFFRDLCNEDEDDDCGDEDDDSDSERAKISPHETIAIEALAEEKLRSEFKDDTAAVVRVCGLVYELYLDKRSLCSLGETLRRLETDYNAHLIFCSELAYFSYNKLLFLSNYVKFVWCYTLNREHFDPRSMTDIKAMIIYLTYALVFLDCSNLTNMPQTTHNPLIAYTGERPKIAMAKFGRNSVFSAEGTRAMLTMNRSSDFGTKSNFIEITSVIDVSDRCINDIV